MNSLDGVMRKTTVAEESVEDRPVVVAAAEALKRKELIVEVEVEGKKNIFILSTSKVATLHDFR